MATAANPTPSATSTPASPSSPPEGLHITGLLTKDDHTTIIIPGAKMDAQGFLVI